MSIFVWRSRINVLVLRSGLYDLRDSNKGFCKNTLIYRWRLVIWSENLRFLPLVAVPGVSLKIRDSGLGDRLKISKTDF